MTALRPNPVRRFLGDLWSLIGECGFEPAPPPPPPMARQRVIEQWSKRVVGEAALRNPPERGLRVAEEAIELAQAMNVDVADLHRLVDYVYARPAGSPGQEIAGTMVTLYAAASCAGVDADAAYEAEVRRIHTPEIEDKVRRRQAEKRALHADGMEPRR